MKYLIFLFLSCAYTGSVTTNTMYVRSFFKEGVSCEKQRVIIDVHKNYICLYIKEWYCYEVNMRIKTENGTTVIATDYYQNKVSIRYIREDDGIAIIISAKHTPNFFISTKNICDQ